MRREVPNRIAALIIGITLMLAGGYVYAVIPSFRASSIRLTAAASAGTAGTAANPVIWSDSTTQPNLRLGDGTADRYVPACTPTTNGDVCSWNGTNWVRAAGGGGSTGNYSFSGNTMDLTGAAAMSIAPTTANAITLGQNTTMTSGKFITTATSATVPPTISWTAPTLGNSWINFGGSFYNAGYYKDSFGFVHLRGLIKSGTIGSGSGAAPFQLPTGYRPTSNTYMATVCGNSIGVLQVESAGWVDIAVCPGGNTNASLDNIAFYAEQ